MNLDAPPHFMSFDPLTKQPNGGYLYHLQRAISERGGFNIVYKTVRNVSEFHSTNEFVDYVLRNSNIDVFGGMPVTDTMERRDAYFQFTGKVSECEWEAEFSVELEADAWERRGRSYARLTRKTAAPWSTVV